MIILTDKQQTSDWWIARLGKVTGSNVAAVLSFRKDKKESAERANYKIKIVSEMLTGTPSSEGFFSPEMQWGVDQEIFARSAYEMKTGEDVEQFGFAVHDAIERFGGSCDGLVGEDGLVEIKCPKSSTHIRWMLSGVVPEEHEPQIMSYLAITGRAWADFVSFDPRLPKRHQLFIKRLPRDDARIAEIEAGVLQFLQECDDLIAELERLNPAPPPAPKDDFGELGITDEDINALYRENGMEP